MLNVRLRSVSVKSRSMVYFIDIILSFSQISTCSMVVEDQQVKLPMMQNVECFHVAVTGSQMHVCIFTRSSKQLCSCGKQICIEPRLFKAITCTMKISLVLVLTSGYGERTNIFKNFALPRKTAKICFGGIFT